MIGRVWDRWIALLYRCQDGLFMLAPNKSEIIDDDHATEVSMTIHWGSRHWGSRPSAPGSAGGRSMAVASFGAKPRPGRSIEKGPAARTKLGTARHLLLCKA